MNLQGVPEKMPICEKGRHNINGHIFGHLVPISQSLFKFLDLKVPVLFPFILESNVQSLSSSYSGSI